MTTCTHRVFGSTGGIGLVQCERLANRGVSLVRRFASANVETCTPKAGS